MMDSDKIKAAIAAMKDGDGDAALALLEAMMMDIASAESGAESKALSEATDEEPEALSEAADEESQMKEAPVVGEDEEKQEMLSLFSLTKRDTAKDAVAEVRAMSVRLAHYEKEAAAREAEEKALLVGELVKFGAELPATAWADASKRVPVPRLAAEATESLRARVEAFKAGRSLALPTPPASSESISKLSAADQQRAKNIKDPEQRERFVALRLSRMKDN